MTCFFVLTKELPESHVQTHAAEQISERGTECIPSKVQIEFDSRTRHGFILVDICQVGKGLFFIEFCLFYRCDGHHKEP